MAQKSLIMRGQPYVFLFSHTGCVVLERIAGTRKISNFVLILGYECYKMALKMKELTESDQLALEK